ncbi:carotenoid biosynthesis protein [Massilia sp. 9096]|uniref:carotenoid biosynthesis protein n=1 Tax=Massilia sp. 9096 TaxID=1500894 RepID=UPI0009DFBD25|nr:carotenoid biosynthesis protein [Massilia sp. 9096]
MNKLSSHLPRLSAGLLAAFLLVLAARGYGETTMLFVLGSLFMFGLCWTSAAHLLGGRAAARFVLAALGIGWLAEQLGATRGWFFGSYDYTEVLGPRIGAVPAIIPLMWFALSYAGYVIANLIVWQAPRDVRAGAARDGLMALVGATVVTCYDLGADPYMVYKAKAWIMRDKDGWWFGETVQGFAGWMLVAFAILFVFRMATRAPAHAPTVDALPFLPRHVATPLAMYAGLMLFQVFLGYPVETRSIALFAMGFPLLTALCGLLRWRQAHRAGADEAGSAAVTYAEAAPTLQEAA